MLRLLTVTASKVTDAAPPGSTLSGLVESDCPSTLSRIVLLLTGRSVRLTTPAVTTTRSWLENVERASETADTLMLA